MCLPGTKRYRVSRNGNHWFSADLLLSVGGYVCNIMVGDEVDGLLDGAIFFVGEFAGFEVFVLNFCVQGLGFEL